MNIKREDAIFTMLQTLLTHQPQTLIAWVNEASVGRNAGGSYISFYQPRRRDGTYTEHRFVKVYDNDWRKLPQSIVEEAKQRFAKAPAIKAVMNRSEDEASGLLWPIDNYEMTRFKFKPDDPNDDWRFGGMVRFYARKAEEAPAAETSAPVVPTMPKPANAAAVRIPVAQGVTPPAVEAPAQLFIPAGAAPKPVTFGSLEEALDYAVATKLWPTLEEATKVYNYLKAEAVKNAEARGAQLKAAEMFALWATHIQTLQQSRIAHGRKVPA